jgi:two-component system, NtrC family, sensor kinase
MSVEPILLYILIILLRKTLKKSGELPSWRKYLTWALYVVPVLVVLNIALEMETLFSWFWQLVLAAAFYLILKRPELNSQRGTVYAFLPLVGINILKNIFNIVDNRFFETVSVYLEYADPFAVIWLIAMLIISRKQRRALAKEHDKRVQEEEQNKIITARKAELESLVAERTAEITQQKEELQHALDDLKAMQGQLIQSEKMASLGELTAGIAHEIQNPLNFVNNFSEVNTELIIEMKHALQDGNAKEALVLAGDIQQNLEKITHHGKRADGIVKSMLLHSRISTGIKESTDLNALVEEYLNLAYHGLRAKDKSFNAKFKIDLDPGIGKLNIVPQDVGRVLLNIFNNAFYAVMHRKVRENESYEPLVSVSTKLTAAASANQARNVEIHIRDNGFGIPATALEKIFQPFFTTKPAGHGTGLGLSMSYDIITKGHSGDIKVKTKEGEFAEFIIYLPAQAEGNEAK